MTLPSETLKQWREEAQNTIDNIGASYTGCDAEMESGDALTIEDNRRIIALIDALMEERKRSQKLGAYAGHEFGCARPQSNCTCGLTELLEKKG